MSDARELLAEIQDRADRAESGPWTRADGDSRFLLSPICEGGDYVVHACPRPEYAGGRAMSAGNAEFIAAARADVPRLVAALTAVLDEHAPIIISGEQTADLCRVDDELLPCRTIRLLTRALTGDPRV